MGKYGDDTEDKCEAKREKRWREIDKCGFCRRNEAAEIEGDEMEEGIRKME